MNAGGPYTQPSWVSVLTPNLFDAKRSTSERKRKKTNKQTKTNGKKTQISNSEDRRVPLEPNKTVNFLFKHFFPLDDRQLCLALNKWTSAGGAG